MVGEIRLLRITEDNRHEFADYPWLHADDEVYGYVLQFRNEYEGKWQPVPITSPPKPQRNPDAASHTPHAD